MAIKSALISTVNSFYTIVVTILKIKASLLEIINNFYGTVINETQSTTNTITNPSANIGFSYNVFILKQGHKVTIKGALKNNTDSVIGGIDDYFFEITNSEYLGNTTAQTIDAFVTLCPTENGNSTRVHVKDNKIYVDDLGALDKVNLDIHYFTQN
jgi:hypothetical protein